MEMPRGFGGVRGNSWGKRKAGTDLSGWGKQFYRRQLINIVICILIVLAILIFKSVKLPITQQTTDEIKNSLNLNYKLVDLVKSLTDFNGISQRVISVFGSDHDNESKEEGMIFPVKGEIVLPFGEVTNPAFGTKFFNNGMDIRASEDKILAAFDGVVTEIGRQNSGGLYVIISHDDSMRTIYKNVDKALVKKGDSIEAGSVIANIDIEQQEKYFRFEVMQGSEYIDPAELFNSFSSLR